MTASASLPAATDAPDPLAPRRDRQLGMLQRLAEIGMDLAEGLKDRAADTDAGDLGLAFSRISRAVRQTIALEERIAEDGLVRDHQIRAAREQAASQWRDRLAGRRSLVESTVSEAIIEIERPEAERERLLDDLDDWMDAAEDEDFAARPIGEIVGRICRDLGLPFEFELWEEEDWAQAEILHRTPGSPYALRSHHRPKADSPPPLNAPPPATPIHARPP